MLKGIIKITGALALIVLLISLLAACERPRQMPGGGCTIQFQATVRQGPSAGLSIAGDLKPGRISESGSFEGALVREGGLEVDVAGQVNGQAINLVFDLGDDRFLFGTGTLQNEIDECQGVAGGHLVGPEPGDSGGWTGRCVAGRGVADDAFMRSMSIFLVGLALVSLLVIGGMLILIRLRAGAYETGSKHPSVGRAVEPEMWTGEAEKPIAQFTTTYALGDDRYDMSFAIDSDREFLGECGVAISEVIGRDKPKKVTALEIWMFDKNDIQTVTKILMSECCFGDQSLHDKLARKGEAVLILPDGEVELETRTLKLRARVVEMDYGTGAPFPRSFFNKVTLELGVWRI